MVLLQLTFYFGYLLRLAGLLLLALQFFDHTVDCLQTFFLGQIGEYQQRVLQIDGVGMWHEFVEYFRAIGQFFVVFTILVQKSDGLAIAALGIVIFLQLPIEITQGQQQHTFFNAAAGGFFITLLIGVDSLQRVLLHHVDITHGVIHLVEVILVIVVGSHTFQAADHCFGIALGHYLCLGDAGIELQFVGRVTADGLCKGMLCLGTIAQLLLYLSHEEPLAGLLLVSALMLDYFAQVWHRLLVVLRPDIVVCIGVVPVLHCPEVHRVAAHIADDVLGIVEPFQFSIALCEPGSGHTALHGLCLVEACHITECGCCFVEVAFLEL